MVSLKRSRLPSSPIHPKTPFSTMTPMREGRRISRQGLYTAYAKASASPAVALAKAGLSVQLTIPSTRSFFKNVLSVSAVAVTLSRWYLESTSLM